MLTPAEFIPFGLGPPEIAAIAILGFLVLGRRRIVELANHLRPPGPPSPPAPLPGEDIWLTLRRRLPAERIHFKRPA